LLADHQTACSEPLVVHGPRIGKRCSRRF